MRLGQRREQVGGARSDGAVTHAHATGNARVGIGRVAAAALIAHQHVRNATGQPADALVQRQRLTARDTEHPVYAALHEQAGQSFANAHNTSGSNAVDLSTSLRR